jgi:FeS assembly SUF system protein
MDTIAIDPKAETETIAPVAAQPAAEAMVVSSDPAAETAASPSAIPQAELDIMTEQLIERLKTVYDPEIPVDIYELGLIYRVDISDDRDVVVDMTLTAPGCPVAGDMPGWVQNAVEGVQGVRSCNVNLTFDPPWDPSRMSDEAKLQLNMF